MGVGIAFPAISPRTQCLAHTHGHSPVPTVHPPHAAHRARRARYRLGTHSTHSAHKDTSHAGTLHAHTDTGTRSSISWACSSWCTWAPPDCQHHKLHTTSRSLTHVLCFTHRGTKFNPPCIPSSPSLPTPPCLCSPPAPP